ncbi:MAG: peptide-methionine (R)-S-oxide reductase MsrB, partial [Sciscionella sp.]
MKPVVGATPKIVKTDEQWREELGPEEYAVLRNAATERPYT